MKLQLLRNSAGKLIGIAFVRKEIVMTAQPARETKYHRFCECCLRREASVFCRTHSLYVCDQCLGPHRLGADQVCNCISMAVARDLAFGAIAGEMRVQ